MKKYIICFISILLHILDASSQNLIKNPGFEQHIGDCGVTFSFASFGMNSPCHIRFWSSSGSTPDAYCSGLNPNFSPFCLPWMGNGYSKNIQPHQDSSCVGIYTFLPGQFVSSPHNNRELLQGELTKPMAYGHLYEFSVWVHLLDTITNYSNCNCGKIVGINSLSAYFSDTMLNYTYTEYPPIHKFIPQVQINQMVSDTGKWIKLIDTFRYFGNKARYINIGNFKKDGQFQWVLVDSIRQGPVFSYFFIDDVSLIDLYSNNTGLEEDLQNSGEALVVSPNPTTDHISLTGVVVAANSTIEVIDLLGKLCLSVENKTIELIPEIDISKLPAGVYFVKLIDINGLNHRVKIVKQ
jgi:hypothetical protein